MTIILQFIICMLIVAKVSTSSEVLYDTSAGDVNSDKLVVEKETAYVGGTNYFLIVDLSKPSPGNVERINFAPDEKNRNLCKIYRRDSHCENTVRILEVTSKGVLICGTNAGTPKCFYYNTKNATFIDANLDADSWLSESPTISTKSHVSDVQNLDDHFYAASTKSEASGGIFVRKIPTSLETTKDWFNEPEFKGIYSDSANHNAYLFFNEKSTNFVEDKFITLNDKKDYYSMVARVCKNDQGGSWKKDEWVTFNKVRLTCPWPGNASESETDLLYNELVSTYQSGNSIFGLFHTNRNWDLPTYALAEFDLQHIDDVIEGKYFSIKRTIYFDETRHENAAVFGWRGDPPPFLPGECPPSTPYSLKSEFERFVRGHTLVKMNALPTDGKPFFISNKAMVYKFIFVEKLSSGNIVYLLSENGDLKKIAVYPDKSTVEIFERNEIMNDDIILAAELVADKGYILATTTSKVITISLQQCVLNHDCNSCNVDPHCGWLENADATGFECKMAETSDKRTCFVAPDVPQNLLVNLNEDDIAITWDQRGPSTLIFNVITIQLVNNKELIYSEKTTDRKLIVKRSVLRDGCDYEVSAKAVNNSAMSSEAKKIFTTDMQKPEVTLYQEDDRIGITWTKVSGAKKYIVLLLDSTGETTHELSLLPTNSNNILYLSDTESDDAYTVEVKAISEDGVESSGNEKISSVVQTKSKKHTSTIQAKVSAVIKEDCTSMKIALVVIVVLLVGAIIIILHGCWVIKPGIVELKNDQDGFIYERRMLCIWSKRKQVTHLKCENAMISASEA